MRALIKPALLVAIALTVIVLPFLIFGELYQETLAAWRTSPPPPLTLGLLVVGLLATDILLPVPSSPVSTLAGAELGIWWGAAASWLGMTAGATLGFALARAIGWPLAARMSDRRDLVTSVRMSRRYGAAVLVLFRAVPILAEATVLLMGALRMPWRRFLPPVMAANLGISLAYAGLGQAARAYDLLPAAIVLSIAVPLAIATIIRGARRGRRRAAVNGAER
ncbi:MAG: VTT domain-containing protein [Pirellulales bacterium]